MEHSVLEQALHALYRSDTQIVRLLTLRHRLAAQLAREASAQGAPPTLQERLSHVLSRLTPGNPGPLDTPGLAALFAMVISLTEPLSISLSTDDGGVKKG